MCVHYTTEISGLEVRKDRKEKKHKKKALMYMRSEALESLQASLVVNVGDWRVHDTEISAL